MLAPIALLLLSAPRAAAGPACRLEAPSAAPDPFRLSDGRLIRTREQWRALRRPELKRLFEDCVYGRAPAKAAVAAGRPRSGPLAGGGRLVQAELAVEPGGRTLRLAIFLPEGPGPFPVFVAANKCGNHTVHPDPALEATPSWVHPACRSFGWSGRGDLAAFWSVPRLLREGFGLATFHESDLEPDRPEGGGVRAAAGGSWGAVAAWAWGLSRAADFLAGAPGVDARRLIAFGHSRRGKAALLAAAFDERFAMAVAHQSGTAGLARFRANRMETAERIAKSYPHWFAEGFALAAREPERLPVDQELLAALMAPRPLLGTEGRFDLWANYGSASESLRRADAVYRFLGAPARPAQLRRWTWHTMNEGYWVDVIRFARASLPP